MTYSWWGILPFCLLLLLIAVAPLTPGLRERWHGLGTQLGAALGLGVPVALWLALSGASHEVLRALVEYAHFITLLLSLYVVTGAIFVKGDIRATPRNNTAFLAIGAVAASFIGTTGASMLLVRPLLNTNRERQHKVHTFVFAIIVVANTGGLLTPLGDPPLFLGMLRGVPFLWTLRLAGEWLFVNGMLLLAYHALDRQMYARESAESLVLDDTQIEPIAIQGRRHLPLLAAIVAAAALLPSFEIEPILRGEPGLHHWLPLRETAMLGAAAASWRMSRQARRAGRKLSWGPILEVAALFVGIFLTMIPALRWVARIAPSVPLNPLSMFALTGGLSSVLDNAPTYAVFFELAKGLGGARPVAGVGTEYLTAISLGAVFCGAGSYIGNGPNFMVKAIAESGGVRMPTFGAYVFRWVLPFLVPVLLSMALLFIAPHPAAKLAGAALALAMAGWHVRRALRHPDPHRTGVSARDREQPVVATTELP
jgi:Na+/H+ antiporter NhaD/arsenite permease-like protein